MLLQSVLVAVRALTTIITLLGWSETGCDVGVSGVKRLVLEQRRRQRVEPLTVIAQQLGHLAVRVVDPRRLRGPFGGTP